MRRIKWMQSILLLSFDASELATRSISFSFSWKKKYVKSFLLFFWNEHFVWPFWIYIYGMYHVHAQKSSNWGIWYWINIHCEMVEFMNLIEITSYVQRIHRHAYVSSSQSIRHCKKKKYEEPNEMRKRANLFDSARSGIELLNLKHVPVSWEDWTTSKKKNWTRKMCIRMKCIFRINCCWFDSCRRCKTFIYAIVSFELVALCAALLVLIFCVPSFYWKMQTFTRLPF